MKTSTTIPLLIVSIIILGNSPTARAQSSNAPPSGLVAWWPAEGNADDIVGGNNGTLENGAGFAPGEVGQAFAFSGANQFVQIPDAPALEPVSLTLACWFDATNDTGALITKPVGDGSSDSYAFWFQGGSLNGKICNAGADGSGVSFGFTPSPGTWYHVAYTFDSTTEIQSLYLNGALMVSNSANVQMGYDSHPVLIGADNDSGSTVLPFTGALDEVMIYNRALSQGEIAALYSGSVVTNPPAGPSLGVALAGNQTVLFWDASATNCVLQSTASLSPGNWVAATDAVPVIAFVVTNTSPQRFFRLVSP